MHLCRQGGKGKGILMKDSAYRLNLTQSQDTALRMFGGELCTTSKFLGTFVLQSKPYVACWTVHMAGQEQNLLV